MPNNLSKKIAKLSDEEDTVEDLDKTLLRTHKEFRMGNESSNNYEFSPKDVLDDYEEFN